MSYLEAKRLYKGQIHGIRKTHLYEIYSGIQNLLKNFNATIYKITVQASTFLQPNNEATVWGLKFNIQ